MNTTHKENWAFWLKKKVNLKIVQGWTILATVTVKG